MAEFEYGPVDLYLVGFEGDRPDEGTLEAIRELVAGGEIRLLDFLVVSREPDGSLQVSEFEEIADDYGFGVTELETIGLVGDEDVEEFAEQIPVGTSAALLAIELVWAKRLASRFAQSGGIVLAAERIPAPVVNAVLAEAEEE